MKRAKVNLTTRDFPAELHPFLSGAEYYDSSSSSCASVLYIHPGYFLKIDSCGELKQEALLTDQFHRWGLGPEVILYLSKGRDYLLTRAVPGENCLAYLDDPQHLCQVLACALRRLHQLSPIEFPISARLKRYLDSAQNWDGGYWDASILMPEFMVHSREEAWQIMQENKHRLNQDVCIHGDFCLPNILLEQGQFRSFIDLPLAGAGDRHIDLYLALWSLRRSLNTDRYTGYFLDLYGRDNFDYDMLRVIAAFEVFG